ncbi:hypothetical protein DINM_021942 [Dirofilaria immitis]|nr:hypothetical protein [Dirofilaria immitis]
MIRSVSIVVVWILAVEGERIILHSGSAADADRGNGTAEGKWNNEIDNGDYNDDEGFANENFQDNDIYVRSKYSRLSTKYSFNTKRSCLDEKEMIDEDLNIVVKTNVKRVKRASRAGSSRKVKVAQERHNNRFDNSNSSKKNQNHRKYKVADN